MCITVLWQHNSKQLLNVEKNQNPENVCAVAASLSQLAVPYTILHYSELHRSCIQVHVHCMSQDSNFCNKWPFFVALSRQSPCCNQVVVDLVESSKDELWSKELSSVAFGGWILNPHAFGPANFILPRILLTSACVSFYNDDRQDLITCWQNVFTISQ